MDKPYDPSWLEKLRIQDDLLIFQSPLNNSDALKLGLLAVEQAKRMGMSFSFRVIVNGAVAFSHLMDGTGLENEWWMDKKLNTVRETGISTLRLFYEITEGLRTSPPFLDNLSSYAVDGGCIPLRGREGELLGYIIASGNDHQYDHEAAAEAVARFLGVEIPSLIR